MGTKMAILKEYSSPKKREKIPKTKNFFNLTKVRKSLKNWLEIKCNSTTQS